MPDPKYVGEAIDVACEVLKRLNDDGRTDQ